jgi:hypothetical protein
LNLLLAASGPLLWHFCSSLGQLRSNRDSHEPASRLGSEGKVPLNRVPHDRDRNRLTRARSSPRILFRGTLVCLMALLAPALWNGYPLLQYDTGGYLARWCEGYLVPSRSTVFGLFLHAGEGLRFWPELVLQAGCTVWVIWLVLRAIGPGTGPWRLAIVVSSLSLLTALSVLSSMLLTDIFAGLAVLSLHLLIFHGSQLCRTERFGLFLLIAFAAASHSATLAVLLAILILYVSVSLLSGLRLLSRLFPAAGTIAKAAMLLAANFALSGQLAWTPGGFGIAFGRILQDGIVKRYLDEHCPDARLKLCPYRSELPRTADDFLWSYGIFNDLGRFSGLGEEMRFIVLRSGKSTRCSRLKPRSRAPQPNSASSALDTVYTTASGTLMGSSSASFPENCRPCKKRGNSRVR